MEPQWWSDVRQALADGGKPELINKLWSEFQEAQNAGARKMADRIVELIEGQRNGIDGDEVPEVAARLGLAMANACVRQAVKERRGDG